MLVNQSVGLSIDGGSVGRLVGLLNGRPSTVEKVLAVTLRTTLSSIHPYKSGIL